MVKNCTDCGHPVKDSWTACYHCLANVDGYKLYLSEKDLCEFCEAICELEFTYNNPENEKYFDFFMLFKNLFDAMSFYVYGDGAITRIAEFYLFISPFFQINSKCINSEYLHDRMESVLKCVWTPLKEQGVFDLIDGPKAMVTLPQVNEKEKREQHLKSQIWWLGTTINISLRGAEYNGIPLCFFNLPILMTYSALSFSNSRILRFISSIFLRQLSISIDIVLSLFYWFL